MTPSLLLRCKRLRRNGVRAFSLTELLVGLTVIAVLASLAYSGLTSAIDRARDAGCVSNLRQIGLATSLYAGENNGYFPAAWNKVEGKNMAYYLQPFMPQDQRNNNNIWICPGAEVPTQLEGSVYMGTYSLHNRLSDYPPDPGKTRNSIPITRVLRPSEVILFGDGCQSYPSKRAEVAFWNPWEMSSSVALHVKPTPGPDNDEVWTGQGWLRYRHNNGVNVVMVDGHVENIKKGELTVGNVAADR